MITARLMTHLLLLREFCSDQAPEGAGIGLAPCQQVIGPSGRLEPGILAMCSDHVLSGSNDVGVGDHDRGDAAFFSYSDLSPYSRMCKGIVSSWNSLPMR